MHCGVLCWHGDLGGSWQRRGHGFFPSDGSNASKGMEVLGRTKSGKSWYLHGSFTSQTKFEELSLLVLCEVFVGFGVCDILREKGGV